MGEVEKYSDILFLKVLIHLSGERHQLVDEGETEHYVNNDPDTYPMFNMQAKWSKPLLVTLEKINKQLKWNWILDLC